MCQGVGAKSVEKLLDFAQQSQMPLFYALERAGEAGLRGKGAKGAESLFTWMHGLAQTMAGSEPLPLAELLERVLTSSGYTKSLREENTVEAQARLENLEELASVTAEFDQNRDEGAFSVSQLEENDSPLESFLVEVSLLSDQDRSAEELDQVTLMTLHSAKGLEYPVVFLSGLEEETFPHIRSMDDPEQMEEERRICYVGLTRAEERLFLSAASTRTMHGNTTVRKVSRFLEEIPEELFSDKPDLASDSHPGAGGYHGSGSSSTWNEGAAAIGSSAWKGWGKSGAGRSLGGPKKVASTFKKGDTVEHKVFGKGKVTELGGAGDILTVDFVNGSTRKLKSNFLKKTDGGKGAQTPKRDSRPADGKFKNGERVRHTRWGNGFVKSVVGDTLTLSFPGITVSLPQGDESLTY